MKKVNGFVVSAIAGFFFTVFVCMFIFWECDPSQMKESQRFVIALCGVFGSFLGLLIYGMQKRSSQLTSFN